MPFTTRLLNGKALNINHILNCPHNILTGLHFEADFSNIRSNCKGGFQWASLILTTMSNVTCLYLAGD